MRFKGQIAYGITVFRKSVAIRLLSDTVYLRTYICRVMVLRPLYLPAYSNIALSLINGLLPLDTMAK